MIGDGGARDLGGHPPGRTRRVARLFALTLRPEQSDRCNDREHGGDPDQASGRVVRCRPVCPPRRAVRYESPIRFTGRSDSPVDVLVGDGEDVGSATEAHTR